jgi:hypothetical protein
MVLISAYSKRDCCTTRAIDIRTIDHHPLAGLGADAQNGTVPDGHRASEARPMKAEEDLSQGAIGTDPDIDRPCDLR